MLCTSLGATDLDLSEGVSLAQGRVVPINSASAEPSVCLKESAEAGMKPMIAKERKQEHFFIGNSNGRYRLS